MQNTTFHKFLTYISVVDEGVSYVVISLSLLGNKKQYEIYMIYNLYVSPPKELHKRNVIARYDNAIVINRAQTQFILLKNLKLVHFCQHINHAYS